MWGLLALAFLVVPILEIYVVTQVAGGIGWLNTIGLVIVVSLFGAFLVKQQGFSLLSRVQRRLRSGEMPGKEIVDGMLVAVGGALLLTPGFLTDALGLALLLPPTRVPIRMALMRRFQGRVQVFSPPPGAQFGDFGGGRSRRRPGDVIDGEVVDDDQPDTPALAASLPNSGERPGSRSGHGSAPEGRARRHRGLSSAPHQPGRVCARCVRVPRRRGRRG